MFHLELVGVVGFLLHDFEPDYANTCSLVAYFFFEISPQIVGLCKKRAHVTSGERGNIRNFSKCEELVQILFI